MPTITSVRQFMERAGLVETYRPGWAPGFTERRLPIHDKTLIAPPLPIPEGVLRDQGNPPPDRVTTTPWPVETPRRVEEEPSS